MCWSEADGRHYFQNNDTQVTTWEDPRGQQAAPDGWMQRDLDRIANEKKASGVHVASGGWQRSQARPELTAEGLHIRSVAAR